VFLNVAPNFYFFEGKSKRVLFFVLSGEDESRAQTCRGKYLYKTLNFKFLRGMMFELY
jgi:hypothetical protein